MIGHITKGNHFNPLIRYLTNKESSELLATNFLGLANQRGITNATEEFKAQAALNPRVRHPVFHLSLSPGPNDPNLDEWQWIELGQAALSQLGFQQTQYLIVQHNDTTFPTSGKVRPHIHCVANRVDDRGNCISDSFDYRRTEKVLRHLEQCYGLEAVPSSWEVDRRSESWGQRQHQRRSRTPSRQRQLQDVIDHLIDCCDTPQDFVHQLETSLGVNVNQDARGWSIAWGNLYVAGYQLGKQYTWKAVERRIAQSQLQEAAVGPTKQLTQNPTETQQVPVAEPPTPVVPRPSQLNPLKSQPSSKGNHALRHLNYVGNGLGRVGDELNGFSLLGAGVQGGAVLGALGVMAVNSLQQTLEAEEQKRVERMAKQLKDLDERTSRAEAKAKMLIPGVTQDFQAEGGRFQTPPWELSIQKAGNRIDQLSKWVDPEYRQQPLQLDHNAPIHKQLDQLEAYVNRLSKQMERVEKSLSRLESSLNQAVPAQTAPTPPQPQKDQATPEGSQPKPANSLVMGEVQGKYAQSLWNYAEIFRAGSRIPLGSNYLCQGKEDIMVYDPMVPGKSGIKFAATKESGYWQVSTNRLNQTEQEAVLQLPQSKEQYQAGKALVSKLKETFPEVFQRGQGSVTFKDADQQPVYEFQVDSGQLQGFDRRQTSTAPIFQAALQGKSPVIQAAPQQESMQQLIETLEARQREVALTAQSSRDKQMQL